MFSGTNCLELQKRVGGIRSVAIRLWMRFSEMFSDKSELRSYNTLIHLRSKSFISFTYCLFYFSSFQLVDVFLTFDFLSLLGAVVRPFFGLD